jgi:hypothetical protein
MSRTRTRRNSLPATTPIQTRTLGPKSNAIMPLRQIKADVGAIRIIVG